MCHIFIFMCFLSIIHYLLMLIDNETNWSVLYFIFQLQEKIVSSKVTKDQCSYRVSQWSLVYAASYCTQHHEQISPWILRGNNSGGWCQWKRYYRGWMLLFLINRTEVKLQIFLLYPSKLIPYVSVSHNAVMGIRGSEGSCKKFITKQLKMSRIPETF